MGLMYCGEGPLDLGVWIAWCCDVELPPRAMLVQGKIVPVTSNILLGLASEENCQNMQTDLGRWKEDQVNLAKTYFLTPSIFLGGGIIEYNPKMHKHSRSRRKD